MILGYKTCRIAVKKSSLKPLNIATAGALRSKGVMEVQGLQGLQGLQRAKYCPRDLTRPSCPSETQSLSVRLRHIETRSLKPTMHTQIDTKQLNGDSGILFLCYHTPCSKSRPSRKVQTIYKGFFTEARSNLCFSSRKNG